MGSYNLEFSSCGKNGGRGCGASEVKEITEVEGAKLFVHNVWEASPDELEEARRDRPCREETQTQRPIYQFSKHFSSSSHKNVTFFYR